ncbi:hypothetical protein ACJX0J_011894 [Zea mays]
MIIYISKALQQANLTLGNQMSIIEYNIGYYLSGNMLSNIVLMQHIIYQVSICIYLWQFGYHHNKVLILESQDTKLFTTIFQINIGTNNFQMKEVLISSLHLQTSS